MGRHAFALDYRLYMHNLTLTVSGTEVPLLNNNAQDAGSQPPAAKQHIITTARIGDDDGANPPWFPMADSILLFWWIHKEHATIPLEARWIHEEDGLERLELWSTASRPRFDEPLLVIRTAPDDISKTSASAPGRPKSSSPSITYPLRVAIISVLAPSSIFVNDLFGDHLAYIFSMILMLLFRLLVIAAYVLLATVVVIILQLCIGRRAPGSGERTLNRLQRVSENSERLLRIATISRWSNPRQNNDKTPNGVNSAETKDAQNSGSRADLEAGTVKR